MSELGLILPSNSFHYTASLESVTLFNFLRDARRALDSAGYVYGGNWQYVFSDHWRCLSGVPQWRLSEIPTTHELWAVNDQVEICISGIPPIVVDADNNLAEIVIDWRNLADTYDPDKTFNKICRVLKAALVN